MPSSSPRFIELTPDPVELVIDTAEVARTARCGPPKRWQDALEAAVAEARELAVPRARALALTEAERERLFEQPTPVAALTRAGDCWAFVATLGPKITPRVDAKLAATHLLEGVLLDAAASAGVEALGDLMERHLAGEASATRFSPGYCSWSLEAQRPLFDLLRPEELGIALLPSLLMEPLKSISGVVLRAPAAKLRVPAPVCAQCDARGCTRRQAPPPKKKLGSAPEEAHV